MHECVTHEFVGVHTRVLAQPMQVSALAPAPDEFVWANSWSQAPSQHPVACSTVKGTVLQATRSWARA